MTEEVISVPSATVSIEWLLELRDFLNGSWLVREEQQREAYKFSDQILSILSNYKL